MARSHSPVGKRGIALAWGALLGAVLLWQTFVRAARPDGIDLTSYLLSARALAHGASPYMLATPFPYLYPATLAFLLIPLAMAPSIVALIAWFALNAFAAVWSVRRANLPMFSTLGRFSFSVPFQGEGHGFESRPGYSRPSLLVYRE